MSSLGAQPANDQFANRALLIGTNISLNASLAGATFESSEPVIDGVSSGQTAWWTWIAPSDGLVNIFLAAHGFEPLLGVYTSNALGTLQLAASNNYVSSYEFCGLHSRVRDGTSFKVDAHQAYSFAIDSALVTKATRPFGINAVVGWVTNVLSGGDFQLGLKFTPAPTNDLFSSRILLRGSRSRTPSSNIGARKEIGEPNHLGNPGGSSVWFTWTAPASGRVTLSDNEISDYLPPSWSSSSSFWIQLTGISDCGVEFEVNPLPMFFPLFASYIGKTVDTLIPVNCLHLNLPAHTNAVAFDAVKGQTYEIAYDGNMGTSAGISLYLALTKAASNDCFERRIKMHGIYIDAYGYNAGATHQPGEPTSPGSLGKTVWWSWLAPVSGSVRVSLAGSDYAFPVAVFQGAKVDRLRPVGFGTNGISFAAVQGESYHIAVSDAGGLTGEIQISLQAPLVLAPMLQWAATSRAALVSFMASPGQTLLLQESKDRQTWYNVSRATAHGNSVSFRVRPGSADKELYYRAIIVDLVSR